MTSHDEYAAHPGGPHAQGDPSDAPGPGTPTEIDQLIERLGAKYAGDVRALSAELSQRLQVSEHGALDVRSDEVTQQQSPVSPQTAKGRSGFPGIGMLKHVFGRKQATSSDDTNGKSSIVAKERLFNVLEDDAQLIAAIPQMSISHPAQAASSHAAEGLQDQNSHVREPVAQPRTHQQLRTRVVGQPLPQRRSRSFMSLFGMAIIGFVGVACGFGVVYGLGSRMRANSVPSLLTGPALTQATSTPIASTTDTPVQAAVMPTPTPSPSPILPTTTPTSLPTPTPSPSPTTNPDTPSGTVLEVGQPWHQDGLELTLSHAQLRTDVGGRNIAGPGLIVTLRLTNRSGQELPLHISTDNLAAFDNNAQRLRFGHVDPLYNYYDHGNNTIGYDVVLQPGSSINLALGRSDDSFNIFINANITDPSLTEVIVQVSGIVSINNAQWRIPIAH